MKLLLLMLLLIACNETKKTINEVEIYPGDPESPLLAPDTSLSAIIAKYELSEAMDDNIMSFLIESKALKPIENFCVAKKETNNGRAGIGKKYNNHHGLKRASTYRMWTDSISRNNDLYFASWIYSYLNYNERCKKYKAWCNWQIHKRYAKKVYKKCKINLQNSN